MARIDHRSASTVHAAIARKFCAPQWATFFEVRDDAGFKASRSADAVSVATWPSMGLAIHGFEVKVSRTDFLREMKQPDKCAPVMRYCDRWWLAIGDESVADVGEVPETWGLLLLQGKRLLTVKEAPKLTPGPLDRGFVAALLRRASEHTVPKSLVHEQVEAAIEERVKLAVRHAQIDAGSAGAERDRLREAIKAFSDASGVEIYDLQKRPKETGAAVRALMRMRGGELNLSYPAQILEQALALLKEFDRAAAAVLEQTNGEDAAKEVA